jgi:hypothetical protein
MSLTRLITWMSGVSEIAIRALPPVERLRLAHECRRLLVAAEPQPAAPKVIRDAEIAGPAQERREGTMSEVEVS